MPSRGTIEDQLAEIGRLSEEGPTVEAKKALVGFLRSRKNLLAARAAGVVRDWLAPEFLPELLDLWERSLVNPVKNDKACLAKLAVVETLDAIEYDDPSPYLHGVRHVQLEPAYGPPVDSAVELRIACARILASNGHSDIHVVLADLLMDSEPGPRKAAAEIAAGLGGERGELLLRMRAIAGDDHTENYAVYFRGLLEMSPRLSLPLVESYTRHEDPAMVEEAVLALGESRLPEVFGILKNLLDTKIIAEDRRVIILGIGLLRTAEAVDFLEEVVLDHDSASALYVVDALGVYRETTDVMDRFRAAFERRGDPRLRDALDGLT